MTSSSPRMKPVKPVIYSVRHGESITNVTRSLHKRVADPAVWLTQRGHEQAQQAGVFLAMHFNGMPENQRPQKVRIFRSFYLRARQTAEHIEEELRRNCPWMHLEVKEHARLRELEFGYAGFSAVEKLLPFVREVQNLLRYQGHKYLATRMGGESPAGMEPRVRLVLDAAYRDFAENDVTHFIFVSHGLTARVLTMAAMGYDTTWYQAQDNPDNCSIRLLNAGFDEGFIFPNSNGQWDPAWVPEEPEAGDAKLNPKGMFFSPEEMEQLITYQQRDPGVMLWLDKLFKDEPDITASEAISRILNFEVKAKAG